MDEAIRMNAAMEIVGKSTLENLLDLKLAILALEKRINSPFYGPMLQDDPDDLCS